MWGGRHSQVEKILKQPPHLGEQSVLSTGPGLATPRWAPTSRPHGSPGNRSQAGGRG